MLTVSDVQALIVITLGDEVPPKSWRVPYAASVWRAVVVSKVTGAIIAAEL
jgi:hypothetical protein